MLVPGAAAATAICYGAKTRSRTCREPVAASGGGAAQDTYRPRIWDGGLRARTFSASPGKIPNYRAARLQPAALPAAGRGVLCPGLRGGGDLHRRDESAAGRRAEWSDVFDGAVDDGDRSRPAAAFGRIVGTARNPHRGLARRRSSLSLPEPDSGREP